IRLEEDGLILNTASTPLHAGLAFAAGISLSLWLWVTRDIGKCLLTLLLIFIGWLAAVNTAYDLYQVLIGSDVFGTELGAKKGREGLGLLLGGVIAGAVGAGLVAFGTGVSAPAMRRVESWLPVVLAGGLAGVMLYPAVEWRLPLAIFVPWQALVAAAIGFGLTVRK
ncbi:MAG: hypothetical protein AAF405_08040, partial [Pseudomonadota bacterium]